MSIFRSKRENLHSWRVLQIILVTTTLVGCALAACRSPQEGQVLPSPQATVLPHGTILPQATVLPHATILPRPTPFRASRVLGTGRIRQVTISADGEHLAVAANAGIFLYHIDTFERVWNRPCTELDSEVESLAFSPDGLHLASAGNDGTIRLWPVPGGVPFHTLPREEFLDRLRALTNLRAVEDADSDSGYAIRPGPFPGWERAPHW